MDRDTILRRAAKLAALASDRSNLAEAESAGDKLAELLHEHRLSMTDVDVAAMRSNIKEEDRRTAWHRLPKWAEVLSSGIADACNCQSFTVHRQDFFDPSNFLVLIRFVGEAADVAVAGYWFETLALILPKIAARAKRDLMANHRVEVQTARAFGFRCDLRSWHSLRESFLAGASLRLAKRLMNQLAPPVGSDGDKGRALVVVKEHAIAEWIAQKYKDIKHARGSAIDPDRMAVNAGMRAADNITLASGIANAARPKTPALAGPGA